MMHTTKDPIVIVGTARTPMGSFQGALSGLTAVELGAAAIEGALRDTDLAPQSVQEVFMGCVLPAGLGQAPARQAAIAAGLPPQTPCTTINKVCGSGMKAVMLACQAIHSGVVDVVVAGGTENMSAAPYLLPQARSGYRLGHGQVQDHMVIDGLQDAYGGDLMGCFAELCAEHYGFTRQAQDAYALESLARAQRAIEQGHFQSEITPVTLTSRKGEQRIDTDEPPGKARPEKIPHLSPAFKADGTVTAANASSIADGAAALVLMRQSQAQQQGLSPKAIIRAYTQHAQEPQWFTTAPVGAVHQLMKATGWTQEAVDLFEINEAFAVVAMAAMQELHISHAKLNVHGGACALGHPLGASGARILVTLLAALQTTGKTTGMASLCIGGGEATAMAIERVA